MRTASFSIILACMALVACLAMPRHVLAAEIELEVPRLQEESQQQMQGRALQAAFTRAVYDEALTILPGELQPLRRELLYDFLSKRSARYVQGYSDVAYEPTPNGARIYARVTVNRNDLRKILQNIGVFYTVDAFLPYTLSVGQGLGLVGEEITRLQFLSGMSSIYGAKPKLSLEHTAQGVWVGHLESDSGQWSSRSKDLETVWLTLWGNHFSRSGLAARGSKALSVQISGWKTPEGIQAFDEEIKKWDRLVSATELVDVALEPGGLTARWQILTDKVDDTKQALTGRVAELGLTVLLQAPDTALDTLSGQQPPPR